MQTAPTERFSSRVDAYIRYRPHYPSEVIDALREHTGLKPSDTIADIGAGTGISAEIFLVNGNFVYAVEPNAPMREAGIEYLRTWKNLRWKDGTAEATTLRDHSVDYIIAAQAFHWFNNDAAYREFKRILKPEGWLVILWNDRETNTSPFLIRYEALLQKYGTDYNEINHRNMDSQKVRKFFRGASVLELEFENIQTLDYAGLEGRLVSSSYVPNVGDKQYAPMIEELHTIFNEFQVDGHVEMRYKTLLYAGTI